MTSRDVTFGTDNGFSILSSLSVTVVHTMTQLSLTVELEEWTIPGRNGTRVARRWFTVFKKRFDIYCIFPEFEANIDGIWRRPTHSIIGSPQLANLNKASFKYILQSSIVSNPSSSYMAYRGVPSCNRLATIGHVTSSHLCTFLAHAIEALDAYQRVEYPEERPCIVTLILGDRKRRAGSQSKSIGVPRQ